LSPNIIGVLKSGRKRWAGHVTQCGGREMHVWLWWGKLKGRDHLEDPEIDVKIIIIKKHGSEVKTGGRGA